MNTRHAPARPCARRRTRRFGRCGGACTGLGLHPHTDRAGNGRDDVGASIDPGGAPRHRSGFPRHRSGFSLLEMLVVMLLVAIVAAIALPGYQRLLQRGHRAEARGALLRAAHWLEREATADGLYPQGALPPSLTTSDGGRYRILRQPPGDASPPGLQFTLQAVPQGGQARDACGTFILTHTGERGVTSADASAAECWGR